MFHKFSLMWCWFVWATTFFIPDFPLSMRLRGFLYSFGMKNCGRNFQVASGCRLISADRLTIGSDVYFAPNVIINGVDDIFISDEVMIGFASVIVSGNHTIHNQSYRNGKRDQKPIIIGRGSWIGAQCSILAGSIIPNGSLIAAGAVVTKNLGATGKFAGVPARRLK